MSILTTSSQYTTGSPSQSIQARKRKKGIQIRNKEVKLSLFADNMILYMEDPKDFTKKVLELINKFSKAIGCKINKHKSVVFLYTSNVLSEKEIKQSHL